VYLDGPEDFKTVYLDPGESAGWCLACGNILLSAGTTPLWLFADALWEGITDNTGILGAGEDAYTLRRKGMRREHFEKPIGRIVCEDFRIYPEKAKALIWNPIRTLRLIGAVTFMARLHQLEFQLQPASIKERAKAGGAEEFFYRPLHENRHQNDAIMHFTYFSQLGPEGDPRTPNEGVQEDPHA
jgi:hypothetical protein